MATCHVGAKL